MLHNNREAFGCHNSFPDDEKPMENEVRLKVSIIFPICLLREENKKNRSENVENYLS
jgi:hypothetical protein